VEAEKEPTKPYNLLDGEWIPIGQEEPTNH
jgi:hypothetical protein